jgi:hypothetical protein
MDRRGLSRLQGRNANGVVTYLEMAEKAAERIYLACQRHDDGQKRIKAILDAYNAKGSTRHVSFSTSKSTWRKPYQLCGARQRLGGGAWP